MKLKFDEIVLQNKAHDRVRVLRFSDQIPELMSVSDLVVTKPRWFDDYRVFGFWTSYAYY